MRSSQSGIVVKNPTSGWFYCAFAWNPKTKKFFWKGFTKTQIFNEEETEPNLKFHVWIIKVLLVLKQELFPNLYIHDEGDFYFTEEDRKEKLEYFRKQGMPAYITEWEKKRPFDVNVLLESHGSNLSMIKNIGGMLEKCGFDKDKIVSPMKDEKFVL